MASQVVAPKAEDVSKLDEGAGNAKALTLPSVSEDILNSPLSAGAGRVAGEGLVNIAKSETLKDRVAAFGNGVKKFISGAVDSAISSLTTRHEHVFKVDPAAIEKLKASPQWISPNLDGAIEGLVIPSLPPVFSSPEPGIVGSKEVSGSPQVESGKNSDID